MPVSAVPAASFPTLLFAIDAARQQGASISAEAEALVVRLFHAEGRALVRLARLFVDDKDAAEDLVQEAFLRLARHATRIEAADRAPAYLRSIVLNLARDHNRRGLVSLRHRATQGREVDVDPDVDDRLVRTEEVQRVLDAVRRLPRRQRDAAGVTQLGEDPSAAGHGRAGRCPGGAMTPLEDVLAAAFAEARAGVEPNPDLFARVVRGVEEARQRRSTRWRAGAGALAFVLALAALGFLCTDRDNGRIAMPWWTIELITDIVLVALAVVLGPFIKRFGRSYAADVFRANPRTGKSYLMLTDVAYYLVFAAFVLFTISFERRPGWIAATGNQLEHEVARVGGILLIMGVLHAANVVALPVIGRLLESNRRLDLSGTPRTPPPAPPPPPAVGGGTWVLRIEPAPPTDPPA